MKFSLIIPVAPERDAPIIESLKNIDYPKSEFHVIVVKGKNPSENRNKGILRAKGEIIGFLDDDAIVDSRILKNVEEFFIKYPEIDIVGGPQLTPLDERGFAKISGYVLSSKFGVWKIANRYSGKKINLNVDETALTSANLFCKNKVFEKIKFDMNLFPGEDPKFIEDAKKEGFKVAYSPNIIIYHKRRPNIISFIRQIFNYGYTRPAKESFINTLKKPFFLIPSIFVLYLVLLLILAFRNITITGNIIGTYTQINTISLLLLSPLFLYIILNLIFSIIGSVKNRDCGALFVLLWIFFIIHVSYGLGFFISTIKRLFK